MKFNKKTKAVILAGSGDVKVNSAAHPPAALWPIMDQSVIQHLIKNLADHHVPKAAICCSAQSAAAYESIQFDPRIEIEFLHESLPLGPAGCIRAAVQKDSDELLLVLSANMTCPVDITEILSTHQSTNADMTVMFNPAGNNGKITGQTSGIYVCNPDVTSHIPEEGYFDIKEGLIPKLVQAGKKVYAKALPAPAGNFRNFREYLFAVQEYLEYYARQKLNLPLYKSDNTATVWARQDSQIHESARLFGPVVILQGAAIEENTTIFGPAVIGPSVTIARDTVIVNSVCWKNSQLDPNCKIQNCVITENAFLPTNNTASDQFITPKPGLFVSGSIKKGLAAM